MKKGLRSVLFSVLVGALLLCAGCGKSGDIYTAGVYTCLLYTSDAADD
mgnify:CR=1 FL=1